jgi:hypothetical protein
VGDEEILDVTPRHAQQGSPTRLGRTSGSGLVRPVVLALPPALRRIRGARLECYWQPEMSGLRTRSAHRSDLVHAQCLISSPKLPFDQGQPEQLVHEAAHSETAAWRVRRAAYPRAMRRLPTTAKGGHRLFPPLRCDHPRSSGSRAHGSAAATRRTQCTVAALSPDAPICMVGGRGSPWADQLVCSVPPGEICARVAPCRSGHGDH